MILSLFSLMPWKAAGNLATDQLEIVVESPPLIIVVSYFTISTKFYHTKCWSHCSKHDMVVSWCSNDASAHRQEPKLDQFTSWKKSKLVKFAFSFSPCPSHRPDTSSLLPLQQSQFQLEYYVLPQLTCLHNPCR